MKLIDEITSSALFASLYGTKRTFERSLGLNNIIFVFHNNTKYRLSKDPNPSYPYYYFKVGSIGLARDEKFLKAIQRDGISSRGNNRFVQRTTDATVHKYFMFPARISCEFHYFHNDLVGMTKFLEAFLILSATESLNFVVTMSDEIKWICRIEMTDDTLSTPDADLENPADPASNEIVVNFILHTHIGFMRDVAKVNNLGRPTLTFTTNVSQEQTEEIPDKIPDPLW